MSYRIAKRLLPSASAVLLIFGCGCCSYTNEISAVLQKTVPSVPHVSIEQQLFDLKTRKLLSRSIGSGTVFSVKERIYILTAAHVIQFEESVPNSLERTLVLLSDGGTPIVGKAEEVRPDGLDLAIISIGKIPGEITPRAATLSWRGPRRRANVFAVGSSVEEFRRTVSRRVGPRCNDNNSTCEICGPEADCFTLTEMLIPGFSGGGVYNTSTRLVGINIGNRGWPGEEIGMCISIKQILPYLKKYL